MRFEQSGAYTLGEHYAYLQNMIDYYAGAWERTSDAPTMAQDGADLRLVLEESLRLGVVPILVTKADDMEGGDRIDTIIRDLAAEYQVPLWGFWLAAQPLPNGGLASTRLHPSYAPPIFDDP